LTIILGCDEVNFSPSLAGECVVCVYYNPTGQKIKGVTDSKKVAKVTQRRLFKDLTNEGVFTIGLATVNSIDHVGIYVARNYAIIGAVQSMLLELDHLDVPLNDVEVLLDGKWSKQWLEIFKTETGVTFKGIIHGDALIYEISCASIVARVYADMLFCGYAKFWPGYNLEHNHGSPDKIMYRKLRRNGPSPAFRVKGYAKLWWARIMAGKQKHHGRKKSKKNR